MSTQSWRIIALTFLAFALILALVAVVLYRVLDIRQVRNLLTGHSEAEEIHRMRSARVGTWGSFDAEAFPDPQYSQVPQQHGRMHENNTEKASEFVVHSIESPLQSKTNQPVQGNETDDESQTSLMGESNNASSQAVDDESQTTLSGRTR